MKKKINLIGGADNSRNVAKNSSSALAQMHKELEELLNGDNINDDTTVGDLKGMINGELYKYVEGEDGDKVNKKDIMAKVAIRKQLEEAVNKDTEVTFEIIQGIYPNLTRDRFDTVINNKEIFGEDKKVKNDKKESAIEAFVNAFDSNAELSNIKSQTNSKARAANLKSASRVENKNEKTYVVKEGENFDVSNPELSFDENKLSTCFKGKTSEILVITERHVIEYIKKNPDSDYTYLILDEPINIMELETIDITVSDSGPDDNVIKFTFEKKKGTGESGDGGGITRGVVDLGGEDVGNINLGGGGSILSGGKKKNKNMKQKGGVTGDNPKQHETSFCYKMTLKVAEGNVTKKNPSGEGTETLDLTNGKIDFIKTYKGKGDYLLYRNSGKYTNIELIKYGIREYQGLKFKKDTEVLIGTMEGEIDGNLYYKIGTDGPVKHFARKFLVKPAFRDQNTDLQSYMFTFYVPVHSGIKTGIYLQGGGGDIKNKFELNFYGEARGGIGRGKTSQGENIMLSSAEGEPRVTSIGTIKHLVNQLNQNDKGIWGYTKIVCNEIGANSLNINADETGNKNAITDEEAFLVTQEINKGTRYEKMFFQASSLLIEVCNSIVHRMDNVTGNYYNIPFFDKVKNVNDENQQAANDVESLQSRFSSFSFINTHINSITLGDYMAKKQTQTVSSFRRVEYVTNLNQKDTGASKYEFDDEHKIYIIPGIN